MLLRIALLATLTASSFAQNDCQIPKQPMSGQPSYFVFAPRSAQTYAPCNTFGSNVTIVADSGSLNLSLGHIYVNNLAQFNGVFTVKIYDGQGASKELIANFTPDTFNPTIDAYLQAYVTTSTSLTFEMLFSIPNITTGTLSAIFYPILGRTTPGPTSPQPPTSTPVPFTNTAVPFNPAYVNTDLAVVWVSTGNDSSAFEKMRNTIAYMAQYLTFTTDSMDTTGSRLSLQSLNRVPADNNLGIPWEWTQSDFLQSVAGLQSATSGQAVWLNGINAFLRSGGFFDINQLNGLGPRPTAQRVFAFFTQTDIATTEYAAIKAALEPGLTKFDVHMVIVDYSSTGLSNVSKLSNETSNVAYYKYDDSKPYEFLSNYITRGDQDPSFGCAPSNKSYALTAPKPVTIPPTYTGPMSKTNGTNGRYCNQMNTWIDFNATGTDTQICFVVDSYELEVEKDWMKIYQVDDKDNNIEQVVLNGIEVSKSQFTINSKKARVQFLTNSDTVLGGANFTVSSGACPNSSLM